MFDDKGLRKIDFFDKGEGGVLLQTCMTSLKDNPLPIFFKHPQFLYPRLFYKQCFY